MICSLMMVILGFRCATRAWSMRPLFLFDV
ncbi:Uncharacterised protein [Bordetella pertussis]|nr:Uncharacterised protein [Bordetella pertussis]